ncbi:MAG: 2-octaprenyl-6-methoxyphenol hydroxylase [Solimicrobium sp.]|nr:2-octaprenyl-6-methoxyphenol hydroxylase [Solimicrobium sp.]
MEPSLGNASKCHLPSEKFDVAICGAGPVGQTLALLLVKQGINPARIVLIDGRSAEQASQDQRTIVLSYGSQQILQAATAWPIKSTEIHQIHVSRRGHFGRTLIDRAEHHVPALGYVTRYADLLKKLTLALEKTAPRSIFLRSAKVGSITQMETHAQINFEDRATINASIVVQAEGGIFNEQAPQTKHHNYQQTALIAHVKTRLPIAARAFERFTEQGPLALLPQDDGYALVWCVRPDTAARLLTLNDNTFLAELQTTFGDRLGNFIDSTPRFSFELGLNAQTNPPVGRSISLGNAAQTLHPVAGQGLNLGLRDAYKLAQLLSKSLEPESLQKFFLARQSDRKTTIQITDQLAKIFTRTPDGSFQQTLLSTGLGLIDLCAPAQQWLTAQMMFGRRT